MTSRRSGTGWGILGEVRDGLGDPRACPGRIGGPSGRSGTGRGNLEEVRETLGEIRDGRGTLEKV